MRTIEEILERIPQEEYNNVSGLYIFYYTEKKDNRLYSTRVQTKDKKGFLSMCKHLQLHMNIVYNDCFIILNCDTKEEHVINNCNLKLLIGEVASSQWEADSREINE